jgi:hypothetical protein
MSGASRSTERDVPVNAPWNVLHVEAPLFRVLGGFEGKTSGRPEANCVKGTHKRPLFGFFFFFVKNPKWVIRFYLLETFLSLHR